MMSINETFRDVLLNIFDHFERNTNFLNTRLPITQLDYCVMLVDVVEELCDIYPNSNSTTNMLTQLQDQGPVLTEEDIKILTGRFTQPWSNRGFWVQVQADILKYRFQGSEFDRAVEYRRAVTVRPCVDWGQALKHLKSGMPVTNLGWNGSGLTVHLQLPDAHSKMTLPYFYLQYPADHKSMPNARVPWVPSVTDNLSESWVLI